MDKNTFYDILYLRDILNPKIQKILNQDKDTINSHLYNAGSLINENEMLGKEDKEKLNNIIIKNLK